jgi:transposase
MSLEKDPEQKKPIITRQELYNIYDSGRENTVLFMQLLLDKIERHEAIIKEHQEQIKRLEEIISKDSHNSNKPPSSDSPYKKTQSLRKKTGKKPGGQKGHEGFTRTLIDDPDIIHVIPVDTCEICQKSLKSTPAKGYERRQITDIPEIKPATTEYRAEIKDCSRCCHENRGAFPEEASAPVQFGENINSVVVYLTNFGLLPNERCAEIISALFHVSMSTGTIVNMNLRYAWALAETGFEAKVKAKLKKSKVIHADETGMNINKELNWLHVCSTDAYTYYFVHPQRGHDAMDEMGIFDDYGGTVVHDFWKSYYKYNCNHALCNGHHLRELIFLKEVYKQVWAEKMIKLLLEIKEAVECAKFKNKKSLGAELIAKFERKYRSIIREGLAVNPPPKKKKRKRGAVKRSKSLNLLLRFKRRREETIAFMYDFKIPFDNNLGERDIRMMKLQQKISGLFRTFQGARNFCLIRSYISTIRKLCHDLMSAIKIVFTGGLPDCGF